MSLVSVEAMAILAVHRSKVVCVVGDYGKVSYALLIHARSLWTIVHPITSAFHTDGVPACAASCDVGWTEKGFDFVIAERSRQASTEGGEVLEECIEILVQLEDLL